MVVVEDKAAPGLARSLDEAAFLAVYSVPSRSAVVLSVLPLKILRLVDVALHGVGSLAFSTG